MSKTVSQIIGRKEVLKWVSGDIITIAAGTGAGKSYFIKNTLYEAAKKQDKKILMLIHRKSCVEQFTNEVVQANKTDFLVIKTYQCLEQLVLHDINLEDFGYIVCDEFHYFTNDAKFNNRTDISFNRIIGCENAVRIMMSATAWDIKKYINLYVTKETKDYYINPDFSFIRSLNFFYKDETLEHLADTFISEEDDSKAMFFIQSAKKAFELFKRHRSISTFCKSESNRNAGRMSKPEVINEMLYKEKFETKFLIATSSLDSGVNIVDEKVNKIVVDMQDIDTIIQCIGRKRIECPDEQIDVYIKSFSPKQVHCSLLKAEGRIKKADYLIKEGVLAYADKYYRKNDNDIFLMYDDHQGDGSYTKKVNKLLYHKIVSDIKEYRKIKLLGEHGYCKYIARALDKYKAEIDGYNFKILVEEYELQKYLDENVDKIYYTPKDREELYKIVNLRKNGRVVKNINSINEHLKKNFDGMYCIDNLDFRENGIRYRSAWQLKKHFKI